MVYLAPVAQVEAVVFDLDGTLVDSRADIVAAASHALRVHGWSDLPAAEIVGHVGNGARRLVAGCAGIDEHAPEVEQLLATFLDYYTAHPTDHSTLLPGVASALAELSGLPLAVCTNKPRVTTDLVLANLDLARHFSVVVAGGDLPRPKPDPVQLRTIAARLRVRSEHLVMVGDGPQDVECGRAVGAFTVGVDGGLCPRQRLLAARPDVQIASMADLPETVRRRARDTRP
jgi:phosphoglycolate phosphatase